jgi:NADH-quinone oxidoreductase subunit G
VPTIFVEDQAIEASADHNLLEVLLSNGIDIPYFCWHPAMGSVGACRQCAVVGYANAEDTRGRIVMACMTPIIDGGRFSVQAQNAAVFRGSVIENLMLNHPHDCPVCEEGGECHLQDMTVMVGHRDRDYKGLKRTFRNQYLGPLIGHEMNRCITCYRCVRYYQDYAGGSDLAAFGSRDRVFFGRAEPGILNNEFAGNLVEVCPTGVFTDKTLSKHYTRKWDLSSAPTICQSCSLGCNTYTSERYGEVRRVHNRYHHDVNGYFLCDRGRFGAQHVNSPKRIRQAGLRNPQGQYDRLPIDVALAKAKTLMTGKVVGIGSPRASLEANAALRQLVGADHYCNGMSSVDREMHGVILDVLNSELNTPSMMEVEAFDAILIVGEDVTNHAPRLALSIRQAVRNLGQKMAAGVGISQWHDAAVRELEQDKTSPLIILSPMADRLDDIASETCRLAPVDIVELVEGITAAIHQPAPSAARDIATLLLEAKRPLIVSGTSLRSTNIIKAAANLARALAEHNPAAGVFLCAAEANSIGVAMMDNHCDAQALLEGKPDTVIVLENDVDSRLGNALLTDVANLIVIDALDNPTVSRSTLVLPAATFAESQGTFVNNEGRAQRSMATFKPAGDIAPSYQLLGMLGDQARSADQLRQLIAAEHPALAGIVACAPDAAFRIEGSRVARMTHRASGRTAMRADISVHEPQQPIDTESSMAFSMEGSQQQAPASLRPYTWSPGWNSNQSIHKFQSEVGGPDKSGTAGVRLFSEIKTVEAGKPGSKIDFELREEAPMNLIGQVHIFGSDELSNEAAELSTLIPGPYARMCSNTASQLKLDHLDGVAFGDIIMTVLIDEAVADQCVIYPIVPATIGLAGGRLSSLKKVEGYRAPADPLHPQVITTDRAN